MGTLRIILTVVFILVCLCVSGIVLLQEGKTAGLGSISGAGESFWGKNKSRSREGKLVKFTTVCAVLFLVLAAVLNMSKF